MTTKLTATQRAQDASWEKHGDNHYARMIEAYAFAVRLETMLREVSNGSHAIDADVKALIKEFLQRNGADEVKP